MRESSFAIDSLALGTLGFFFFDFLQRAARGQQAPYGIVAGGGGGGTAAPPDVHTGARPEVDDEMI